MPSQYEPLIQQAIEEGNAGNRAAAKQLLSQALKQNPRDARVWYLLSQVVDTNDQVMYCLNKVLEIQPNNQQVQQRLSQVFSSEQNESVVVEESKLGQVQQERDETPPIKTYVDSITPQKDSQTRKCPYCAGTIEEEDIICRVCGKDLGQIEKKTTTENKKAHVAISGLTTSETKFLLIGVGGIGIFLTCVLFVIGFYSMNLINSESNSVPLSASTTVPLVKYTETVQSMQKPSDPCDAALVLMWMEQHSKRTEDAIRDTEKIYTISNETNFDIDALITIGQENSEQALSRYNAQKSQLTPECLSEIQDMAIEQSRLYWKAMVSLSNGEIDETLTYLNQMKDVMDSLTPALDEFKKSHDVQVQIAIVPTLQSSPMLLPTLLEPPTNTSIEMFESSPFCQLYDCTPASTSLADKDYHPYFIGSYPKYNEFFIEINTKNEEIIDAGITLDPKPITAEELQFIRMFLVSVTQDEIEPSVMDFVSQNLENPVNQICDSNSIQIDSMRLWVGNIGLAPTLTLAYSCIR